MAKYRVAVYGTLKAGLGNHGIIKDTEFVGHGKTEPKFDMISFGGFPGVLDGDKSIKVEVYQFDDSSILRDLDSLEGHPTFFNREEIPITLDSGEVIEAEMYNTRHHTSYYSRPRYNNTDVNGNLEWFPDWR